MVLQSLDGEVLVSNRLETTQVGSALLKSSAQVEDAAESLKMAAKEQVRLLQRLVKELETVDRNINDLLEVAESQREFTTWGLVVVLHLVVLAGGIWLFLHKFVWSEHRDVPPPT